MTATSREDEDRARSAAQAKADIVLYERARCVAEQ
jgi:hypothetical protein